MNGIRITGELTAWSADGIDGSFGRRAWTELNYKDVWRLYGRLIDEESAHDWVGVGRTLLIVALEQDGASKLAESAFRRAERRDETIGPAIAAARESVVRLVAERAAQAAAAEAERLATESPEASAWRPDPWPPLSDEEQAAAVRTMRADARRILERAGLDLLPVETAFFLFYSDMPRRETEKWAKELDLMYVRLAKQFDLAPGENIFWGKAVIFVFNERDRYALVEAEAFGHLVPEWTSGLCHPVGPKVFVNFYRQPDEGTFAAILVHETVHGFMHRYRTPARMPTWANEGFSDYLASVLFRDSPVDRQRRKIGLRYVRTNKDVNAVLDWEYNDGTWPGPNGVGYNIGYLLVELMIRDRPQAFGAWVDAIKAGKDWEQALADEFGVPRAKLVETFVQYYRVND